MLKIVPTVLRFLAGKSEDNPKKAAGISVLTGIAGVLGVAPETLHSVGDALIALGTLLKGF
jgi:hypothetical protein